MGIISNLITDMTLKGASNDELERAVKHSMVIIDAEKHGLDWEQSYIDNNIAELKKNYQTKIEPDGKIHVGGASTLISRAKSQERIPARKEGAWLLAETNEPVTLVDGEKGLFVNEKTGQVFRRSDVRKRKYNPETGEKL